MIVNGTSACDNNKRSHGIDDVGSEASKKLCVGDGVKAQSKKKKKMALLLAYNGKNYRGMQINAGFTTIESELFRALNLSGLIGDYDKETFHLLKFQRAARTDKSVSAAHQVVSLFARDEFSIKDINSHLPSDIRVFSIIRATKSFDSKKYCDARTYSYILPTQVLSKEPMSTFLEIDYRITPELIQQTNDLLKMYVGTHRFHNFTNKKLWGDPSCKRYIMSFSCGEPFVHGKEFVMLTVKGQSFMLYQIRKMIGMIIAVLRGFIEPSFIDEAFNSPTIRTPTAPAEGLFLERPHFDKYNVRYGNDGIHENLEWKNVEDEVAEFREKKIIIPIMENEIQNQVRRIEAIKTDSQNLEDFMCEIKCMKNRFILITQTGGVTLSLVKDSMIQIIPVKRNFKLTY